LHLLPHLLDSKDPLAQNHLNFAIFRFFKLTSCSKTPGFFLTQMVNLKNQTVTQTLDLRTMQRIEPNTIRVLSASFVYWLNSINERQ
jgi:hypothetical protein